MNFYQSISRWRTFTTKQSNKATRPPRTSNFDEGTFPRYAISSNDVFPTGKHKMNNSAIGTRWNPNTSFRWREDGRCFAILKGGETSSRRKCDRRRGGALCLSTSCKCVGFLIAEETDMEASVAVCGHALHEPAGFIRVVTWILPQAWLIIRHTRPGSDCVAPPKQIFRSRGLLDHRTQHPRIFKHQFKNILRCCTSFLTNQEI